MTRPLTERQAECIDVIRSSIAERGYPPTIRQIGEAMGISSTNGVIEMLRAIEKKGHIERERGGPRAIRLLHAGRRAAVTEAHRARAAEIVRDAVVNAAGTERMHAQELIAEALAAHDGASR